MYNLKLKTKTKQKTLLEKEIKRLSLYENSLVKAHKDVSDTRQSGKLKLLFKVTRLLP